MSLTSLVGAYVKPAQSWECAGRCDCDSGMLYLGDPKGFTLSEGIFKSWEAFRTYVEKTKSSDPDRHFHKFISHAKERWKANVGLVLDSGYGRGNYPVMIQRNKHGLISEAKIIFIP